MPWTINSAWEADTDEKFAEIPEIVKEGIIEIVEEKLVTPLPIVQGEKIPKIWNRRTIDLVPDTWAGRLKSDRHLKLDGEKAVHSFLVGYGGITSVTDDNTVGGKCFQLRFLIDSYYEEEIVGTNEDNPEKRHGTEISRIIHAIWMSRTLRRPKFVKKIVDWSERRGFARMGQTITRESLGELVVDLSAVPMVRP